VAISFGYILFCVCFNLYWGGFILFCDVWVCVCVCVCMCVCVCVCGTVEGVSVQQVDLWCVCVGQLGE
jgi:hypothetical protein